MNGSLGVLRDPLEVRPEECQSRARMALEDTAALPPADVHVLASDVLSLAVRVLTLEDRLSGRQEREMTLIDARREIVDVLLTAREALIVQAVQLPLKNRDHGPVLVKIDASIERLVSVDDA